MLILLLRPLDLFNLGFQLSFLAVLGIFTLGDWLQRRWALWREGRRQSRLLDSMVKALAATLAASAFTAPLSMVSFHHLPVIGLIISPIACALVGVLMPYGLVLLAAGALHVPMAETLAVPARWLSQLLTRLAAASASLPYGLLRTAAPTVLIIWRRTRCCHDQPLCHPEVVGAALRPARRPAVVMALTAPPLPWGTSS